MVKILGENIGEINFKDGSIISILYKYTKNI